MKVWAPIFNLIAVVAFILFGATYVNLSRVTQRDFDQARYDYAVKQATEAMFRSTLQAEDISLDYIDMNYISINASSALNIFDRVICANYDMSPSDENLAAIHDGIACCAIAGFDGFYILQSVEENTIPDNGRPVDGYNLRFSAKIPYIVENSSNKYAIDTYQRTFHAVNKNLNLKENTNYTTANYVNHEYPAGVTEEMVKEAINTQVRAYILDEMTNKNNPNAVDIERFRIYFPEETTVTGVNPLSVPGIILMTSGVDYASTDKMTSLSVSGYKAINRTRVIAFTDTSNGRAYYCYEGQLRDEEKTAESGGIPIGGVYGNFRIDNFFKTPKEACMEKNDQGNYYTPYFEIMARKAKT